MQYSGLHTSKADVDSEILPERLNSHVAGLVSNEFLEPRCHVAIYDLILLANFSGIYPDLVLVAATWGGICTFLRMRSKDHD